MNAFSSPAAIGRGSRRRWLVAAALAAALGGLSACGGGGDDEPTASLRFINATQDVDFLDVHVDGFFAVGGLSARLGYTGYGRVFADGTSVEVARTGWLGSLGRFSTSLPANTLASGVLLGSTSSGLVYRPLLENEPVGDPATTRLRLLNAVPGTASYSLFLTGDTDPLVPGNEAFESARFDELSGFRAVAAARYRVRVIRDDDPALLVFDFTGLTLRGGQSGTFVLAPTPGSSRLNLGLFVQGEQGLVMANQAP